MRGPRFQVLVQHDDGSWALATTTNGIIGRTLRRAIWVKRPTVAATKAMVEQAVACALKTRKGLQSDLAELLPF